MEQKTEQELKEILVTLGMEAGWHEIPYQEREMYGLPGLACFVEREPGLADDWYGDLEFDLNFDCQYSLSNYQYNPPGANWDSGQEEEEFDEYQEPTIFVYRVGLNEATGYHYTDTGETLLALPFREFVTMANERIASIYWSG